MPYILPPPCLAATIQLYSHHIRAQVQTVSWNPPWQYNFQSSLAAEMLADYSVAVAMELFQGQEVSPILTFENYIFHCSHAILTRPSKFYCLQ